MSGHVLDLIGTALLAFGAGVMFGAYALTRMWELITPEPVEEAP
jgi:hypothetical protein